MSFQLGDMVTVDTQIVHSLNDDMRQAHKKSTTLEIVKIIGDGTYMCHSPHFTSGHTDNAKRLKSWLYRSRSLTLFLPPNKDLLRLLKEKKITDQQFLDYQTKQKEA